MTKVEGGKTRRRRPASARISGQHERRVKGDGHERTLLRHRDSEEQRALFHFASTFAIVSGWVTRLNSEGSQVESGEELVGNVASIHAKLSRLPEAEKIEWERIQSSETREPSENGRGGDRLEVKGGGLEFGKD